MRRSASMPRSAGHLDQGTPANAFEHCAQRPAAASSETCDTTPHALMLAERASGRIALARGCLALLGGTWPRRERRRLRRTVAGPGTNGSRRWMKIKGRKDQSACAAPRGARPQRDRRLAPTIHRLTATVLADHHRDTTSRPADPRSIVQGAMRSETSRPRRENSSASPAATWNCTPPGTASE